MSRQSPPSAVPSQVFPTRRQSRLGRLGRSGANHATCDALFLIPLAWLLLRGPNGRYSRETRVSGALRWQGAIAPSTETGVLKKWILLGALNKTLTGWTCANGSSAILRNT